MRHSKNCAYLLLFFLAGLSFPVKAQTDCFSANKVRVCVNEEIAFFNCNGDGWSNSYFDYGDGTGNSSNPEDTTHIYSEPGTYYVYHLGQNDVAGMADKIGPIKIVVLPLLPPKFEVESCQNAPVKLSITDTIYNEYDIDWENDGIFDITVPRGTILENTYPTAGDYGIKVRGTLPFCSEINVQPVTVFPVVEEPLIASLNSAQEAQISITLNNLRSYLNYYVEIKKEGGTFEKVLDLVKENGVYAQEYLISQIGQDPVSTTSNTYCVKVTAVDPCGNQSAVQACTIKLTTEALSDQNNLNWATSTDQTFDAFSIVKNSADYQDNLSGSIWNYIDTEVECNKKHCYRIRGTVSETTVVSNEVCVIGRSNKIPATIRNLTATIDNNSVEISWRKPSEVTVGEYILSNITNEGANVIYRGLDSLFTDNSVDPNSAPVCYTIAYVDSCNNKSAESLPACTINLKGEEVGQSENSLAWTSYTGWEQGVKEYILQILDPEGNVIHEISMGSSISFKDTDEKEFQVVRYRIKAVPAEGIADVSFSNIVEIKQKFVIALPNAFTPNGDGKNERFEIKSKYIRRVKMQIYNRWGELLFQGESWDGSSKGNKAINGSYVYFLEAEDETGHKITRKGTVTLLR